MKKTLMMLLIIFPNIGCQTIQVPELKDHERCVLSLKFNKCRCHMYRVSPDKVGRVSESVDKPVEACENLIGFTPDTWVEYVLFLEEFFEAARDANSLNITPPLIETPEEIRNFANGIE